MTGPEGFVSGNIEIRGKQNSLFPKGPVIKCLLLLSSNRCKKVFQHLPVVAFRRSPNLRDLLVTAKLSSNSANPQLPPGSFRCGKNCATCPYISHGLTTYTFFSTGETLPIESNLTCDTKNLIYIIQCNRCNLQ